MKSSFGFIPFLFPIAGVAVANEVLTDRQFADLEAIDRFIKEATPRNKASAKIRDEWIIWWDTLSWYQKNLDGGTLDEARNRRNAYNRADAQTAQEREQVEAVIQGGVSREEMRGEPDRRLSSGDLPGESKGLVKTIVTAIPWWGYVIGAAAVVGGGFYAKKVYIDPVTKLVS
jgi:hypothetical protein